MSLTTDRPLPVHSAAPMNEYEEAEVVRREGEGEAASTQVRWSGPPTSCQFSLPVPSDPGSDAARLVVPLPAVCIVAIPLLL